jgi:hypothetical protein
VIARRKEALVGPPLDARQAEPGGRMQPGAEGHPRVERDHDIIGSASVAAPCRPDERPTADADHREVALPGLCPVCLVDDADLQFADRAQLERLEMAEGLPRVRDRPACGGSVEAGDVGANDRRTRGVDPGRQAVRDELECGLDTRAA